ncbi:MAG: folate-binding protein [Paucimonas sp.]|nr:folate-binding protein [Paucimonas sp.]
MNNWLEFLAEQGARLNDDRNAVNGFTDETDITPATGFVAPLPEFALIRASGEDAAAFLHNQLTNDIQNLKPGLARLAGYCTPKGRLLATSLVWREGDGFMLQLPAEIQPATRKRLQMFVLRSKVKLSATEDRVSLGLAGTAAVRALGTLFPSLPGEPYGVIQSPPGTLIRVADDGDAPRYLWIASEAAAREAWPALTKELAPAGPRAWRLGDIRAGVPRIVRATQEQFVPQMVNFELIGGRPGTTLRHGRQRRA